MCLKGLRKGNASKTFYKSFVTNNRQVLGYILCNYMTAS